MTFAAMPVAFLAPGAGGGGGGGGGVTVSASPSSEEEFGFASSWVFGNSAVSVTGGSPSAFVWSFRNITGGTWSVFSGQGTAVAAPLVEGIPPGGTALAEMVCTVTISGTDYQASTTFAYSNLF